MVDESWDSVLDDAEDKAYREARTTLRGLSANGVSRAAAVYQVTKSQQSDAVAAFGAINPATTENAPEAAAREPQFRDAFLHGRDQAITEFITAASGSRDIPSWVPPVPAANATVDAIVRPILSHFLNAQGYRDIFIMNEGQKWTANCDRGTVTFRLVKLPTDSAPGTYTINCSFMLDTQPAELLIMYRLYARD